MSDTENNVVKLNLVNPPQQAERPGKQEMLDMLEELRKQVESGDIGTIMAFTVFPEKALEYSNQA